MGNLPSRQNYESKSGLRKPLWTFRSHSLTRCPGLGMRRSVRVVRRPPRGQVSGIVVRPGSESRPGPRSYIGPTRSSVRQSPLPFLYPSTAFDRLPPSQVFPLCVELGHANAVRGALWGKRVVDRLYHLPPGLPGQLCRGRVATIYRQNFLNQRRVAVRLIIGRVQASSRSHHNTLIHGQPR